ncbi:Anthranilate O-methyltransferase 3 [Zea mays]|uniref:Salicylate/benzoate carboxyl methyltransferase n=3 Tax=Zea mays TaxID=4577 RepID=K7W4T9_MAIZE|nr:Salicylate/benzoate carboxyl methyltransferase [Zea mays]PWZ06756.1 Anthranilate O-methyltransferase 3 [Zea mays]
MPMTIERDLHMATGNGETSYTKNSRIQEKVMFQIKPVLEEATRAAYSALLPRTMVVADLGCSSGPNTLRFVSEVIGIIARHCKEHDRRHDYPQLQFFLNDLPGNDFNNLFLLIQQFNKSMARNHKGEAAEALPPCYISGLSGSFYTRIFPSESVHLFHSLFSVHWHSQASEQLKDTKNKCLDIYITKNMPPSMVKLFQQQFEKDFSLFLKLRYEELVSGGQMVLTFIGRKHEDVFTREPNHLHGLLAQSLKSLVDEGLVEKEKLESFYLPFYSPSVGEVEAILKQVGLFNMNHVKVFEINWDPYDDSESDDVHNSIGSGENVAKCLRAVMESLVASQFGEHILDKLFKEFAHCIAEHLENEKTKHVVLVLSIEKAIIHV